MIILTVVVVGWLVGGTMALALCRAAGSADTVATDTGERREEAELLALVEHAPPSPTLWGHP